MHGFSHSRLVSRLMKSVILVIPLSIQEFLACAAYSGRHKQVDAVCFVAVWQVVFSSHTCPVLAPVIQIPTLTLQCWSSHYIATTEPCWSLYEIWPVGQPLIGLPGTKSYMHIILWCMLFYSNKVIIINRTIYTKHINSLQFWHCNARNYPFIPWFKGYRARVIHSDSLDFIRIFINENSKGWSWINGQNKLKRLLWNICS